MTKDMKRTIIYILILAVASAAMSSCQKFLDMSPDEVLTIPDVFANRNYTKDFLTHTYSWTPTEANMADDGGAWRNPYTAGSDEMECAFGGAYAHQINNGGWNPTDIKRTQVWPESYMALRKVNMFLENVDACPTEALEINNWKGEAYFLRAWFHFLVFRAYGPVPYLDHTLDPADDMLGIRRDPADEVVRKIVADCDLAAEYLADMDIQPENETGRATRIAALALKSRALLYIASPLYNGDPLFAELKDPIDGTPLISQTYDPEKWKVAADAALDCITKAEAAGYALYNNYPDDPVKNYQNIFLDNWNREILWAKNIAGYDHWLNCADPVSFGCFAILDPTQEMVDAYEMEDGSTPILGYTDNGLTPIINPASGYVETGFCTTGKEGRWEAGVSNMYVGREPRFYASINFAGSRWKTTRASNWTNPHYNELWFKGMDGKNNAGSDYCKTGYLMKKMVSPTHIPWTGAPLQMWVYIRLAEIYLNYAEAINEYEGPEKAYPYVNAIRKRAGLPDLEAGLTQEQMREKIRHERRIELAFEVHRFFDTRRWLIAPETQGVPIHSMNIWEGENLQDVNFYKRIEVEGRVFESPKHYFFPIDQAEIDKHENRELVQNLGWTTILDDKKGE